MGYVLGIDLGTTFSAAAIAREGRAEIVSLGDRAPQIPSVVVLKQDGGVLVGDAAERRSITDPTRTAREFKRRLGDPTPLVLGGTPYGAEGLMGHLLRAIVDKVVEQQGEEPDRLVLTHPANWGPYKRDLLRDAVRVADLENVSFITEPEAAAIHYALRERIDAGEVVAVYDFGGGTFDAAILRRTGDGSFVILGQPEGMERLGGIDFDEAVFQHVADFAGGAVEDVDATDPTALASLARLREDSRAAKEALSSDTEASVPVMLPNVRTEVRLTRSEFEDMVRPRINETITTLMRAIRSAGLGTEEIARVLLVGGSSRIPLVHQMVRDATGRPVAVDAHPKFAIAIGAALSQTPTATAAPTAAAPPVEVVGEEPETIETVEAAAPAAPTRTDETPPPTVPAPPPRVEAEPQDESKAKRPVALVAIAAVLAVLLIGGGLLFLTGGDDGGDGDDAASSEEDPLERDTLTLEGRSGTAVFVLEGSRVIAVHGETVEEIYEDDGVESPVLSPDGRRLAYVQGGELKVRDLATDIFRTYSDVGGVQGAPDFSPDGRRVVFTSDAGGSLDLYVASAIAGEEVPAVRLTEAPSAEGAPSWSPDGQFIAYESDAPGNFDIFVMKSDGSEPGQLTNASGADRAPDFFPRLGTDMLAFESERDGNREIYLVRSDGSEETNLTNDPEAEDHSPTVSGDDDVMYLSDTYGDFDIFIKHASDEDAVEFFAYSEDTEYVDWSTGFPNTEADDSVIGVTTTTLPEKFVEIKGIDEEEGAYVVYFTVAGYSPKISEEEGTLHIHFFFDTVAPENAGTNGNPPGEWALYDGPSPFTQLKVSDRPEGATKICALVADHQHRITTGTGNCLDLAE